MIYKYYHIKKNTYFSGVIFRTLYCAKGNYEFGISRVIKSLEPYQKKLGTDTWFYAKRCFLSLIENMAKHMIMLRDATLLESVQFLEHCESKFHLNITCFLSNATYLWDMRVDVNIFKFSCSRTSAERCDCRAQVIHECIRQIHPISRTVITLTGFRVFLSAYGKDVKALVEQPLEEELMHPGKNTVTFESRLLKSLMLDLI